MLTLPALIPVVDALPTVTPDVVADTSSFFTYDLAIGGLGFRLASDDLTPLTYQTASYSKQQIDQATEAGEQTLSAWWMKSQTSFHGGAGQLNIERVDLPPAVSHTRFDASKNVDVSTPGRVTRLPDTTLMTTDTSSSMVPVAVGTTDYVVYVDQAGAVKRLATAGPTVATFTGITETAYSVTTDGKNIYAAGNTGVWKADVTVTGAATKIASYTADTTPIVGWVKARLMLGTAGAVYELDPAPGAPPVATSTASPTLRYNYPTAGFVWRAFCEAPASILAAGDVGGKSTIVQFTLAATGVTNVLTVMATGSQLPPGERVLSLCSTMGTFLAVGTTAGIRVGTVGNLYSDTRLDYGPLTLPSTERQFPVYAVAARDRFFYAGGAAYDEPGLVKIDLGVQTDQANRFAYASDLIAPSVPADLSVNATGVCVTGYSNRLVFSIPGVGLVLEGTGPGSVRDAWLRTSRIRYGTTEPKLFKFGRVRGVVAAADIVITPVTTAGNGTAVTVGFTLTDPDDFALPTGGSEWLQLKLALVGSACVLTSYGVKALPGTKRQRMIQATCILADREEDRRGRKHTEGPGTARGRLEALYALDEAGDAVTWEEFTLFGPTRRTVVIDNVKFVETGRPTNTSDFGGRVTITVRTVDS